MIKNFITKTSNFLEEMILKMDLMSILIRIVNIKMKVKEHPLVKDYKMRRFHILIHILIVIHTHMIVKQKTIKFQNSM